MGQKSVFDLPRDRNRYILQCLRFCVHVWVKDHGLGLMYVSRALSSMVSNSCQRWSLWRKHALYIWCYHGGNIVHILLLAILVTAFIMTYFPCQSYVV